MGPPSPRALIVLGRLPLPTKVKVAPEIMYDPLTLIVEFELVFLQPEKILLKLDSDSVQRLYFVSYLHDVVTDQCLR